MKIKLNLIEDLNKKVRAQIFELNNMVYLQLKPVSHLDLLQFTPDEIRCRF